MATQATTSRLRKAFRYPSDSDSDADEADLDEEHQERLITSLADQDAQKNELYRKLFLAIPIFAALFYLYNFVIATSAQHRLVALLSVSSCACTTYILGWMPIEKEKRKGKEAVWRVEANKGPLERYIVWMNAGLAGVLALAAGVSWVRGVGMEDVGRRLLGALVFAAAMWVRRELRPMDLEELEKARFGLKGA